jgi:hypothetical protein
MYVAYYLCTANYILYSQYLLPTYEFPNYIATQKKTQFIINSFTRIRFDFVLFNYFLTPQLIPITYVILLFL